MSLNLEAIRDAVIAQIKPVIDPTTNTFAYLTYSVPLPAIGCRAPADYISSYHEVHGQGAGIGTKPPVKLELHVAENGDTESAGRFVDRMLVAILPAIEADPTLGGVVDSCTCVNATQKPISETNVGLTVGIIRLSILTK